MLFEPAGSEQIEGFLELLGDGGLASGERLTVNEPQRFVGDLVDRLAPLAKKTPIEGSSLC